MQRNRLITKKRIMTSPERRRLLQTGGLRNSLLASLSVAMVALGGAPAAASERVQDGGFEAATCTRGGCTSPVWSQANTPPNNVSVGIGPICTGEYPEGPLSLCATSGSGYVSQPRWARIGAGDVLSTTPVTIRTSIEQSVSIPAAPATLRFRLRIMNVHALGSRFAVTIDGRQVFAATADSPPTPPLPYELVEVDVSAFAGGARTLRFEGVSSGARTEVSGPNGPSTDSYDIDDVSLDAAGPPSPPPAPGPGPGPEPGPGPGPDTDKPVLSALLLSPSMFRAAGSGPSITTRSEGSRVSYTLSEAAAVNFGIEQARAGRRVGGSCVRPTRANRRRQRCTRYLALSGSFTHRGFAGANTFRFSGRLRGRKLAIGRYRLRAVATDPSANTSVPTRRFFTIQPRR